MEIERKFRVAPFITFQRLNGVPPGGAQSVSTLQQAYVCLGADGTEVCVRHKHVLQRAGKVVPEADGHSYKLTVKGHPAAGGMVHTEVETDITKEEFDALLQLCNGRYIHKTQCVLSVGDHVVEHDTYGTPVDRFGECVAEVGFRSKEAAAAFKPLPGFGAEVTSDASWKDKAMATASPTALESLPEATKAFHMTVLNPERGDESKVSSTFTPLLVDASGEDASQFRSCILEKRFSAGRTATSTATSTSTAMAGACGHFLCIQGLPPGSSHYINVCVALHADAYAALLPTKLRE